MRETGIWGEYPLADGDTRAVEAGPLHIRIARDGDEIHYLSEREPENGTSAGPAPDEFWKRWVLGDGPVACRLRPSLPPRPVVARPVMPFQMVPGAGVDLFVSIPVWVRTEAVPAPAASTVTLIEEPTVILSHTWFGEPVEGEPCLALKTRARRRLEELRADAHLAVCPVSLRNESRNLLTVERLCLRLAAVSLYAGNSHLWTNRGRIRYQGEDIASELQFEETPPETGDGPARLLTPPREPARRGTARRALESLRGIAQGGWS